MLTPSLRAHEGSRGVLGVDEGRDAARFLGAGDDGQGEGGLAGGFGAEDLDDPPAGDAASAEGEVEGEGAGRDAGDGEVGVLVEPHDRALAEGLLDLPEGAVEGLGLFFADRGRAAGRWCARRGGRVGGLGLGLGGRLARWPCCRLCCRACWRRCSCWRAGPWARSWSGPSGPSFVSGVRGRRRLGVRKNRVFFCSPAAFRAHAGRRGSALDPP